MCSVELVVVLVDVLWIVVVVGVFDVVMIGVGYDGVVGMFGIVCILFLDVFV